MRHRKHTNVIDSSNRHSSVTYEVAQCTQYYIIRPHHTIPKQYSALIQQIRQRQRSTKKNCCDLILSFQNPRNTVYRKQLFHVTLSLCKLRSGRLICSFWIFQSWPCSKYHLISDCQSAITTLSAHNIALLLGIVPYRLSDILSRQSTRLYSLQSSCYVTASVIIDFWLEFQLQWSVSVCLLGLYLAEYRRVYVLLCFLFRFFFFFWYFFRPTCTKPQAWKLN